jgi:anti-sigma factor RsiW
MDCELAQQKIALFAYGELPDDQCPALEGHLATCQRCQEEFAAVQALQQAMALAPAQEPSANLLAQARRVRHKGIDRRGGLVRAIVHGVHDAKGILRRKIMIHPRGAEIFPDGLQRIIKRLSNPAEIRSVRDGPQVQ